VCVCVCVQGFNKNLMYKWVGLLVIVMFPALRGDSEGISDFIYFKELRRSLFGGKAGIQSTQVLSAFT